MKSKKTFKSAGTGIIVLFLLLISTFAGTSGLSFDCPPGWEITLAREYANWTSENAEIDAILRMKPSNAEELRKIAQVYLVLKREIDADIIAQGRRMELARLIELSLARLHPTIMAWPKNQQFDGYCNSLSFFSTAISVFAALAPDQFASWPKRLNDDKELSAADKDFILIRLTLFLYFARQADIPIALELYQTLSGLYTATILSHYAGSDKVFNEIVFRMEVFSEKEPEDAWMRLAKTYSIRNHLNDSSYKYFAHHCAEVMSSRADGLNFDAPLALAESAKRDNDWERQYFFLLASTFILSNNHNAKLPTPTGDIRRIAEVIDREIKEFYEKNGKNIDVFFRKDDDDMLRTVQKNLLAALQSIE